MKVVYGKDGKKFYFTKGKQPTRAFYRAWEQNKAQVREHLEEVLKELSKE